MKRLLRQPLGLSLLLSLLFAGGMMFGGAKLTAPLENALLNLYFQNSPEESTFTPELALVEINDLSTHYRQRWPWSMEKVAELIKKVNEGEPKVIALAVPLLDERKPGNLGALSKTLAQFNALHPPPVAKKKKSKKRRRRRRRRRRKSKAKLKLELARKKVVTAIRKTLEENSKPSGLKKLQEVIKKTPNLVLGYVYYRKQGDVPGADVPYFQKRDLQKKREAESKQSAARKKGKAEKKKAVVKIDSLFRTLGKAKFLSGVPQLDPAPEVFGLRGNENLAPFTRHNGFLNMGNKAQDTVLHMPLFVRKGDRTYPSFALATYIAAQKTEPQRFVGPNGYISLDISEREFALTKDGRYWLNYYNKVEDNGTSRPRAAIAPNRRYLAGDIVGNKEFPIKSLKGKIVIIGMASKTYNTPVGKPLSSIELQATMLANLLQRRGLQRTALQPYIEMLTLVVAALLLGFFLLKLRWLGGLFITLLIVAGLFLGSLFFFFPEGNWFHLSYISIALFVIYILVNWIRDLTSGQLRQETYARFQDRLNSDSFDKIIQAPEALATDGVFRQVTVLSGKAHPMGSHITEEQDPKQIVTLMSNLTNPMVDVAKRNHGMIHQLDGHVSQVLFNAPHQHANHPEQACMAALQMQFEWDSFVPRWQQEGLPVPAFGIGLDTGNGILGNFGGDGRFVYNFLGSSLEYSETLQELNKHYGSRILMSESMYLIVQDNPKLLIREMDTIEFMEDQPSVVVYELLGTPNSQHPLADIINWYEQGLSFYRQRNFQEAIRYFQEITRIRPNDGPAQTMLKRSEKFLQYPPNFQWDGAWKLPS